MMATIPRTSAGTCAALAAVPRRNPPKAAAAMANTNTNAHTAAPRFVPSGWSRRGRLRPRVSASVAAPYAAARDHTFPGGGSASSSSSSLSPSAQPSPMPRGSQRLRLRRLVVAAAQKQQFSSFDDMLSRSEVPVLVDFYATWCGPCQMMSPVLSSVASKLKGRLQVVKIDTDRHPVIASQQKVQALPTITLFVGGKAVFRFEGVLTEAQLMERLKYYLPNVAAAPGVPGTGTTGAVKD
ncbi:hypothetical protein VOLCADRAFT_80487 [Volvox carteri f. nagariensis]|uniref:Thioredoxin domain-containing protein n=1 Tax=Volvox carteri f. nagariensis TaxID=3068 RepID=D8TRR1_VOLCA|nr:uncharacterized protein VOLCADRAFT_80487 [Volvox carteri f. nagariensis]EFJ49941.1 hypothetical protein VOLCADRAFT_80487 [Volvox carteri f. nagariensis]|eukprot:XP_002949006.1 hypothetical protein VOLCADRAFT_80487 [Volvox carteri f. nagariensis]